MAARDACGYWPDDHMSAPTRLPIFSQFLTGYAVCYVCSAIRTARFFLESFCRVRFSHGLARAQGPAVNRLAREGADSRPRNARSKGPALRLCRTFGAHRYHTQFRPAPVGGYVLSPFLVKLSFSVRLPRPLSGLEMFAGCLLSVASSAGVILQQWTERSV